MAKAGLIEAFDILYHFKVLKPQLRRNSELYLPITHGHNLWPKLQLKLSFLTSFSAFYDQKQALATIYSQIS
jgi:hypothetical protein